MPHLPLPLQQELSRQCTGQLVMQSSTTKVAVYLPPRQPPVLQHAHKPQQRSKALGVTNANEEEARRLKQHMLVVRHPCRNRHANCIQGPASTMAHNTQLHIPTSLINSKQPATLTPPQVRPSSADRPASTTSRGPIATQCGSKLKQTHNHQHSNSRAPGLATIQKKLNETQRHIYCIRCSTMIGFWLC